VNLTAVPDVDYVFAYWTIKHHVLNPDSISSFVNFNLNQNDTVIAYFVYNTIPEEETPVIYIPNSFTPDGDMLNDIFRAFPNQSILDGELLIFSRWGELIYKSDAMPFGWDGKYGNKDCEQGVYNYVLNYNTVSSGRKTLTGSVLLIR
jgi:gliding motility-associated-like protein